LFTTSYDEALGIPTEEAAQIALRTQQILYHETNIPAVADPLGGSYYLEWLTNRMEEEATKLLGQIDELGGYQKCWEGGWLKRELVRAGNERQRRIAGGEKVVVGVNKYRLSEQPKTRVFKVDPKVEEEAIARVRKFKAERDNDKTTQALAELGMAAQGLLDDWPGSAGSLMPAMVGAFRADATLGEVQQTLREVLGYGYVW
jgi:methylmalonyl-CoA mutase N-terminal domain/subunit